MESSLASHEHSNYNGFLKQLAKPFAPLLALPHVER